MRALGVSAPVWDDLRFPSQSINPPGALVDPDVESTTGLLLFDDGRIEIAAGVAQFPHSWLVGSAIVPHVHWQKTTSAAGNIAWRLEYELVNNGAVAAMDYGSALTVNAPVSGMTDDDTANQVLISSFGQIDMTGASLSSLLLWRLSRLGGEAEDTYGADARLIEFDIHYQIDSNGSMTEFSKTV
jgi:hypothetical protein